MPEEKEKELSPLEKMNAEERRIILEGPADPDNFKMPDGRTFRQTQADFYQQQEDEGRKEEEVQARRIREQSIEGDPMYHGKATIAQTPAPGSLTLLPAESEVAGSETAKKTKAPGKQPGETTAPSTASAPATTAPAKPGA